MAFVYQEVSHDAFAIMTDIFGNYVCQKLFEFGSKQMCTDMAALVATRIVDLSHQMYGCRVVQRALEVVNVDDLGALVKCFDIGPLVYDFIVDPHCSHAIQKCIEMVCKMADQNSTDVSFPARDYIRGLIQFILDAMVGSANVLSLSKQPYGCRVVQRVLEYCDFEQKRTLLDELSVLLPTLVQDQFGNYVAQHLILHSRPIDRTRLFDVVRARFIDFSKHKFASNVVEKCLQLGTASERDALIWVMINETFDLNAPFDHVTGKCALEAMMRDPYANYVVQRIIDVCDDDQRTAIHQYVKSNLQQLRRYTYAKHIIMRLERTEL
jgi:pumilio RNA-binding family